MTSEVSETSEVLRHRKTPFLEDIKAFDCFGRSTESFQGVDGIDYYANSFWTAGQRQAHRLHEISYRACFKAQLPEFFIKRLTRAGDTVYDPFMGRGTTLLQAALMSRRPAGNDINPLSLMLLRPRLFPPSLAKVAERLAQIEQTPFAKTPKESEPAQSDLLEFFHPATLTSILALRDWFIKRKAAGKFDAVDDWIRMVALNRLTGHSVGFFSVYSLPPNQAASPAGQKKINQRLKQRPCPRDVFAIIMKKSRSLLSQGIPPAVEDCRLGVGQASRADFIDDGSVALIVTSPPFLDIVQYAKDNWMRAWFAGIDLDSISMAKHSKVDQWEEFIRECFIDFARVVKPKGYVAFEVGEVRRATIMLEQNVKRATAGLPFDLLGVMLNKQSFTKTANCWGVSNNARGTNSNRIVILRRH